MKDCEQDYKHFFQTTKYVFSQGKMSPQPNIEKKIIKPADICTTRRLPTLVIPRSPIFSMK